jgi:hypothetical protein
LEVQLLVFLKHIPCSRTVLCPLELARLLS